MAAVVASIVSYFYPGNYWIQVAAFCVASILLLIFTKPITKRLRQSKGFTNLTDQMLDKTGQVVEHINPGTIGVVKIDDDTWSAKSDASLRPGDKVIVLDISGPILLVEKYTGGR